MKILLVDDDRDLLDVTSYALRREGFNVIVATDGIEALRRWKNDLPDLVVLDVGLPRLNGFEVCRKIREANETPVILLTGLSDENSVIHGFKVGADDYVTKPFSARQLAMRIRAVLRRGAPGAAAERLEEIRVGDLMLDVEAHEVHRGALTVRLTPIEFRLLYLLAVNAGRVVSRNRLVEYAWGYDEGDASLLKTHMTHIRKKLRLPKQGAGAITAVHGVGYRLNRETSSAKPVEPANGPPDLWATSAYPHLSQ